MTIEEYKVEGFKEYSDLFAKLSTESQNRIVTLFCASLDANERSWCGDCRNALPVITEAIEAAKKDDNSSCDYIFVGIDRDYWRNKTNDFRQHADLKLTNLPTLHWWENGREKNRLTEGECLDKENVFSFFL